MAVPQTQTSGAARLAVVYITVGAIMDVWTVVWLIWMKTHDDATDADYFWCYGFMLTGLVLVVIGLALGKIGQSARPAEAPAITPVSTAPPVEPAVATPAAPVPTAAPTAIPVGNSQVSTPAAAPGVVASGGALRR
jgi:hypothetical protein